MPIVEEPIREFVLKSFPLARKKGITASEKWLESGVLDSLGILDLVHFLEEKFPSRSRMRTCCRRTSNPLPLWPSLPKKKIAARIDARGKPCG